MTIKIKQKFKRIITHSGRFHADEVFAIAFLLFHNLVETDYEIVRLNNYDNFNKKNTDIVIDISGKLDSKKDKDGKDQFYINPATEILRSQIINHLVNGGSINDIKTTILRTGVQMKAIRSMSLIMKRRQPSG